MYAATWKTFLFTQLSFVYVCFLLVWHSLFLQLFVIYALCISTLYIHLPCTCSSVHFHKQHRWKEVSWCTLKVEDIVYVLFCMDSYSIQAVEQHFTGADLDPSLIIFVVIFAYHFQLKLECMVRYQFSGGTVFYSTCISYSIKSTKNTYIALSEQITIFS